MVTTIGVLIQPILNNIKIVQVSEFFLRMQFYFYFYLQF
jgi:hypothetical protein